MKQYFALAFLLAAFVVPSAFSAEVPSSARKLTGAEIVKLYNHKPFNFKNPATDPAVVGAFILNFDNGTSRGVWQQGVEGGQFRGFIRIQGDQYCWKVASANYKCVFVYYDGESAYEVDNDGILSSINSVQ